jgi:hypothetical protein
MQQPCPHCDQRDLSLLRFILIGELLCVEETRLLLLADLMQEYGLLPRADEAEASAAVGVRARKATLHCLRRAGVDAQ